MKTVNEKIIARNISSRQAALYAAAELRKFFDSNFEDLRFHFSVERDENNPEKVMITAASTSDQIYNSETIALCLGYATRVIEEYYRLFGDLK